MKMNSDNKFAVVGMGGIFPGAKNLDQFWENLINKTVAILPIARDSVEREVFFRPECRYQTDRGDRSYTDLAATLETIEFDAQRFRIPPAVSAQMDANQKLSVLVAEQALASGGTRGVARERIAVIMGNSMIGQTHHDRIARFNCDKFEYYLRRESTFAERFSIAEQNRTIEQVRARIVGGIPGVTEDTAPGVLPNIIAARVNSVFDFRGHAYVIDAACASALAAIIAGIQQLRLGECDAVLCGAADFHNQEIGRVYFSAMGALSAEGSFPFDERASGFVPGDGAGAVLIKRMADAIAAGDRIFAVISGYGQASDGKGKAIAAPNQLGQAEVIRRAWDMAGVPPDSIELIEAHGTATQVGDLSEVNALKHSFREMGASGVGFCGIGSVKSNIGHLKSAAGVAGFLKATLALGHGVLPPTASFVKENPKLMLSGSPFYVLKEAREWVRREHPRRAGVSAFGFGGANYHIAIEEYRERDYAASNRSGRGWPGTSGDTGMTREENSRAVSDAESSGMSDVGHVGPVTCTTVDACTLPSRAATFEPICFSGANEEEIGNELDALVADLNRSGAVANQLILQHNLRARASNPLRLALVYRSVEELAAKTSVVKVLLRDPQRTVALRAKGIAFGHGSPLAPRQIAVLFPGQGSQYPDMLAPILRRYSAAKQEFLRADAFWARLAGHSVSALIDSSQRGKSATEALLRRTENTHPALLVASLASYRVLEEMGLRAGVCVGHSVGEFTALAAARRVSFADVLALVHARGNAFAAVPAAERGAMLAIAANIDDTRRLMREAGGELTVANVNSPRQTVVSGHEPDVVRLAECCERMAVKSVRLNVSHAFHSPLMGRAELSFREALLRAEFRPAEARVMANATGEYYGESAAEVLQGLTTQITEPVNFARSIQRLYEDGIRLFVEVGPSSVLSALTRDCLTASDAVILSSDSRSGDSLEAYLRMVCGLFAAGVPIDPSASAPCDGTSIWTSYTPAPVVEPARSNAGATAEKRDQSKLQSQGVVDPAHPLTIVPPTQPASMRIVYSGVSIGLPGSFKKCFADDNFEQLFDGHNLIERLSDNERQRLVELRISKVVKSEHGATFATLTSLSEVIQLAGKIGRIDLGEDYQFDAKDIQNMSTAIALGVAAGYEALRDAQIPLIHEYSRTAAGGSLLPERWALPQEMQRHTGVIFANGFPMVDPIIKEVSRHLSYQMGSKVREELFEFYDTLIAKISDRESRRLLSDWYSLNRSRLSPAPDQAEVYGFNHHLMTQISLQANNRLARLINARGPNFQLNAACSSAATAVTLAEELIRAGRAKRVIVIGADDPCSEQSLPYLGAGFLSTGACSNEADLYKAALPFDRRRNGMIMGAGAVGIIVEAESECQRRGVIPVCELLGSHSFNTAGHGSQLDVPRYAEELDMFMTRMETQHGMNRHTIAKQLVYVSHETYTPARGGCSEAEAVALRHVFGSAASEIEVSNTKGMTGHTMGASIEEAVAAKSLQFGRAAPVVHHKELDPALEGLKLSRGRSADFEYALRMAAGFGAQGNYILLGRRARGNERMANAESYRAWLAEVSGIERPELSYRGRILVVSDSKPGSIIVERPKIESSRPSVRIPPNPAPNISAAVAERPPVQGAERAEAIPSPRASVGSSGGDNRSPGAPKQDVRQVVLGLVSEVTGYPSSILELDMELEADLGVDTVKQATVLARLGERFGLRQEDGMRLSAYPTLRSIVEFFDGFGPSGVARFDERAQDASTDASSGACDLAESVAQSDSKPMCVAGPNVVEGPEDSPLGVAGPADCVTEMVSEVTGYPAHILADDMELEGDLGIDTVKQATILALLAERLGVARDDSIRMSDFLTIGDLKRRFAAANVNPGNHVTCEAGPLETRTPSAVESRHNIVAECQETALPVSMSPAVPDGSPSEMDEAAVRFAIPRILGQVTAYPEEMLEMDLTLDGDLALTDVQQRAFEQALRAHFALEDSWHVPTYGTLEDVGSVVLGALRSKTAFVAATEWLGRQILALQPAPVASASGCGVSGKRVLILGDDQNCMAAVAKDMGDRGAKVTQVLFPDSASPEAVEAEFGRLVAGSMPNLVVDLTACPVTGSIYDETPRRVHAAIGRSSDCRFALWKRFNAAGVTPERILAVTSLDGGFALNRDTSTSSSALYGLHIGFYKALRKHWSNTKVAILDVPAESWQGNAGEAVATIARELDANGSGVEICYLGGERHCVVALDAACDDSTIQAELGPDEVVLATGGGAGITACILLELARHRAMRFALLGRTKLDPAAQGFPLHDQAKVAAIKAEIQQTLLNRGERVTPRAVDDKFSEFARSAEVFATLHELNRLGSRASYFEADVAALSPLEAAVDQVRQSFGPITTLIHGAGLEISHRLEQKSLDEFHCVHSVKTHGAYGLGWLCRNEPLRRIISLSSISGRFGNAAQLDYSMANSFLDLLARTERREHVRALSLQWSGWGGFGMAYRNTYVRENAEKMGLNFIDPRAGAAAAAVEGARTTGPAEIVLHRGLGLVADGEMLHTDLSQSPFIDWIERRRGSMTAAHRRFSSARDGLLDDHRFGGLPFMPGVGFMEMMAEAARLAVVSPVYPIVYRQLAFVDAFKLYRDQARDVRVELVPWARGGQIRATILSPFVPRAGGAIELRTYATAVVELGGRAPSAPDLADWQLDWTEETDYAAILGQAKDVPHNVHLGPLLNDAGAPSQQARQSRIRWGKNGSETLEWLPLAQIGHPRYPREQFLINPAFMDALHQAGAVLAIQLTGQVHLPVGAELFVVHEAPKQDERYRIVVRLREITANLVRYDMCMLREGGVCCAAIVNSCFQRIRQ